MGNMIDNVRGRAGSNRPVWLQRFNGMAELCLS
jgi:hypothetical protein